MTSAGMGSKLLGSSRRTLELQKHQGSRGDFQIRRAAFTNSETQARIDALSRRAQGEPKNEEISGVLSNIRGSLQGTDANAYFSPLESAVPGAFVSLKGWYGVRKEAINFRGKRQLSSTLSQTTTGIKPPYLEF